MSRIGALAERVSPRILTETKKSYENPLLENEEVKFLSNRHVEQLRKESAIVTIKEYGERETIPAVGELRHYHVETALGYTYDVLVAIPEKLECNISVIGTSAWFTDTEGHNERVVRNISRAGSPVIFVGAEGSGRFKSPAEPTGPITLANSAASLLTISDTVVQMIHAEQLDEDLEAGKARPAEEYIHLDDRYLVGESRGAMVGMGVLALAEKFGQKILGADLIAPCLPRKIQGAKEVVKLVEQFAKEPKEMVRLIGKLGMSRLVHYRKTVRMDPNSLWHQTVIGGALFSGETGALARHIVADSLKHITVFENDFASMSDEWRKIFKDHVHTRITKLAGGHMTIADYETLQYVIGRLKAFQLCIKNNEAPSPENVFDRAHDIAPRQHPLGFESMASS